MYGQRMANMHVLNLYAQETPKEIMYGNFIALNGIKNVNSAGTNL